MIQGYKKSKGKKSPDSEQMAYSDDLPHLGGIVNVPRKELPS
jgi:hypothetical protein